MDKQPMYTQEVQFLDTWISAKSRQEIIDSICKHFNEFPENYEFSVSVVGFYKTPPRLIDDSGQLPADCAVQPNQSPVDDCTNSTCS